MTIILSVFLDFLCLLPGRWSWQFLRILPNKHFRRVVAYRLVVKHKFKLYRDVMWAWHCLREWRTDGKPNR